jgi:signal transduction histidine kinase
MRSWTAVLFGAGILGSVVLIGFADLRSGSAYHLSIFYVIPTAAAGWYLGRRFGLLAGVVAGVNWDIADSVMRTDDVAASLWNSLTRIVIFAALAYLTGTMRVLLEDLRRSQDDLRELLAKREEFLSLMAHELRAPVAAIEAVATGLLAAPALADRERRSMRRLVGQARSLSTLAEGVLAVGRLDAGFAAHLEMERFDVRDLANELAEEQARVRVEAPAEPVTITADRNALGRAVANLVQNALKFSPDEREVVVAVRRGSGGAFIQVVDQGIGLSRDEASRLFRKYARIRRDDAERVEGAGLGLYFTRLIVEAHGGMATVDSDGHGHGSTFSIWLPAAAVAPHGVGGGR